MTWQLDFYVSQLFYKLSWWKTDYNRPCFKCLRPGHMSKDCKSRTCSAPSCERRHNAIFHGGLPKKDTADDVSDTTTAVATNIIQGGLPLVRIKLTNRDWSLNVLAKCESGSSISFVDKSVVAKLQLQGRKAFLSVAGTHGSQDVKTEIVTTAVSAHEKSRPLTTVQFYVHVKFSLVNSFGSCKIWENVTPIWRICQITAII